MGLYIEAPSDGLLSIFTFFSSVLLLGEWNSIYKYIRSAKQENRGPHTTSGGLIFLQVKRCNKLSFMTSFRGRFFAEERICYALGFQY